MGDGETHHAYHAEYNRGAIVFHVESTHGMRMDVLYLAPVSMYMNEPYNIEYLDFIFQLPGTKLLNILRQNVYVLLSCLEMKA